MDVTSAILTGLGLAAAAGLNAYIPLLVVGLGARFGGLELASPYDALAETPALTIIAVLLVIELFSDKVPLIDSVGDLIGTVVRPAAGALLFAATLGVWDGPPEWVGLILGLVTAGGVHSVKASFRPAANAATGGLAAPLVSTIEDVIALVATALALLAPLVLVVLVVVAGVIAVRRRRSRRRRQGQAVEGEAAAGPR